MQLSWPGMDHWPRINLFFHFVSISPPLPAGVFWFKHLLLFIFFIIITIFPKNRLIKETTHSVRIIFDVADDILSFKFIDGDNIAVLLCFGATLSLLFFTFVYIFPNFLFIESFMKILQVSFMFIPFFFFPTSNYYLQKHIEQYLVTKTYSVHSLFSLITVVIYTFFLIMCYIFLSRSVYMKATKATSWDCRQFILLIFFEGFIIQCWSILPFYPEFGSRLILFLNFCGSVTLLRLSLTFPLLNLEAITVSTTTTITLSIITILLQFISKGSVEVVVLFIIILNSVSFYITPNVMRKASYRMTADLQLHRLLRDLSDDENDDFDFVPDIPIRKAIIYLRHMLILESPEASEIIIKFIENTSSMSLMIEGYRYLAIIGKLPSTISHQILDIDRSEVSFFDQQIFCELQFEAIKTESVNQNSEKLDEIEHKVENSLIVFSNSLLTRDGKNVEQSLREYATQCDQYTMVVEWSLRNQPLSHKLIEKYSDFLKRLRGGFIESEHWKSRAEVMSSKKLPFFSFSSGVDELFDNTTPKGSVFFQHYLTENIVSRIKSFSFTMSRIAFALIFVVVMLITFCRPITKILSNFFHEHILLRISLTSYTVPLISHFNTNSDLRSVTLSDLSRLVYSVFMENKDKLAFTEKWKNMLISQEYSTIYMTAANNSKKLLELNEVLLGFDDLVGNYRRKAYWIFIKIVWSLSVPLLFLFFLSIAFYTWVLEVLFKKDCSNFISVFQSIDRKSILQFKSEIKPKVSLSRQISREDNDFTLNNDEIDLDEDDPIQMPIQINLLTDSEENDDLAEEIEENKKIELSNKFPFYTIAIALAVIFLLTDIGTLNKKCQIGKYVLDYGVNVSLYVRILNKISFCASQMVNEGYCHFIREDPPSILLENELNQLIDRFEAALMIKDIVKIKEIAFVECPKLINDLREEVPFVASHISQNLLFLSHFLSSFNTFLAIVFIVIHKIQLRQNHIYFESLKAVLKLLPSQFSSSIVSVVNKFSRNDDNKVKHNDNLSIKNIINVGNIEAKSVNDNKINGNNKDEIKGYFFNRQNNDNINKNNNNYNDNYKNDDNNDNSSTNSNNNFKKSYNNNKKNENAIGSESSQFPNENSITSKAIKKLDEAIVFRRADDAILISDSSLNIIDGNQLSMKLFQKNKEDLIGEKVTTFLPDFVTVFEEDSDEEGTYKTYVGDIPIKVTVSKFECKEKIYVFLSIQYRLNYLNLKKKLKVAKNYSNELLKNLIPAHFVPIFNDSTKPLTVDLSSLTIFSVGISGFLEIVGSENVADYTNLLYNTFERKRKKTSGVHRYSMRNGFYIGFCGLQTPQQDNGDDHPRTALDFVRKCIQKLRKKFGNLKAIFYYAQNVRVGLISRKRATIQFFGDEIERINELQFNCPEGCIIANQEFLSNIPGKSKTNWEEFAYNSNYNNNYNYGNNINNNSSSSSSSNRFHSSSSNSSSSDSNSESNTANNSNVSNGNIKERVIDFNNRVKFESSNDSVRGINGGSDDRSANDFDDVESIENDFGNENDNFEKGYRNLDKMKLNLENLNFLNNHCNDSNKRNSNNNNNSNSNSYSNNNYNYYNSGSNSNNNSNNRGNNGNKKNSNNSGNNYNNNMNRSSNNYSNSSDNSNNNSKSSIDRYSHNHQYINNAENGNDLSDDFENKDFFVDRGINIKLNTNERNEEEFEHEFFDEGPKMMVCDIEEFLDC